MTSMTYFVAIQFERGEDGQLTAGEPIELRSSSSAIFRARNAAVRSAGAIAFARTGNPSLGEFQDAIILAREGVTPDEWAADVDLRA